MLDDLRLYTILQILSGTLFEKSSPYETVSSKGNTYGTIWEDNQFMHLFDALFHLDQLFYAFSSLLHKR